MFPQSTGAIEEVFGNPNGIEFGAVSDRIKDICDGLEAAVMGGRRLAGRIRRTNAALAAIVFAAESVAILKFKRRRELPKNCDVLPSEAATTSMGINRPSARYQSIN